jgi:hypothetical protein
MTETAYDGVARLARERDQRTGETFEKAFDHVFVTEHRLRNQHAEDQALERALALSRNPRPLTTHREGASSAC